MLSSFRMDSFLHREQRRVKQLARTVLRPEESRAFIKLDRGIQEGRGAQQHGFEATSKREVLCRPQKCGGDRAEGSTPMPRM